MCEIGRRIWLKGFCAGNEGNHSYRIGPDRVLCTPTGISKGFLKPDDICTVDMEGKQVAGKRKRTSEILMHLAIYKARPDVKAVIHSHPPHATAFAVAGVDLPTCIHPEAEVFLGAVKTAKYVTPGDTRLGDADRLRAAWTALRTGLPELPLDPVRGLRHLAGAWGVGGPLPPVDPEALAARAVRAWGAGLPMLDGFSTHDIAGLYAEALQGAPQ
mgnify:CR=1 FL=1